MQLSTDFFYLCSEKNKGSGKFVLPDDSVTE